MKLYRIKRNGQPIEHVAGNEGYEKHGWRFVVYTNIEGCKAECEILERDRNGMQTFEPELVPSGLILTTEQLRELHDASKPLVKFLCDNFHPHVQVIVSPNSSEFVEGLAMTKIEEFIKD